MKKIIVFISLVSFTLSNADEILLKNGKAWINVNILEDLETAESITLYTSMRKKIVVQKIEIDEIKLKKFDTLKKSEIIPISKSHFGNVLPAKNTNDINNDSMIGIKIGKNFTSWFPNPSAGPYNFENYSAYSFSIFKMARITDRFFLNYEFVFSWESFHMNSSIVSAKEAFLFYEIPILLKYCLKENQFKILSLLAGPAIGAQERFVLRGSGEKKFPIYYLILGLAYQYNHFVLELRYKYSLTDAYDTEYSVSNVHGKLGSFSISVGLMFY